MITFSLEKNGITARLETTEHFDLIRNHFSVVNTAARYARFKSPFISNRKYCITPTGRFDPPLYTEILKFLTAKNISSQVAPLTSDFQKLLTPSNNWKQLTEYSNEPYPIVTPLRDYQIDIVKICLDKGRGVIELATAGGKTVTIASLISRVSTFKKIGFKCLIIVPDLGLVNQTYADLVNEKIPLKVAKWTGSIPLDLSAQVIVANIGILQSKCSDIEWIHYVDLLIVDECHKVKKENIISDIIKKIKTPHKFGLTGTLPEDVYEYWNIIGKIGPLLYQRKSAALRKDGYIADVKVQILQITYKPVSLFDYRAEINYIIGNQYRNKLLSNIANKVSKNCLLLVDFIAHGEMLTQTCRAVCLGKQVFFIRGEIEVEERERIKNIMENNNNVVIIAISKIFSTGINIKNLHYILFCGGGKAKIKTLQAVGRGLRLHKDKTGLVIFDIADNLKYGNAHVQKRKKFYEQEEITYTLQSLKEE